MFAVSSALLRLSHYQNFNDLMSGVGILQKKPKNAPGGINSALAKFPEFLKLSGSTPYK